MSGFLRELQELINRHSKERGSNTPDFILAEYLNGCLESFGKATRDRALYFGAPPEYWQELPAPTKPDQFLPASPKNKGAVRLPSESIEAEAQRSDGRPALASETDSKTEQIDPRAQVGG